MDNKFDLKIREYGSGNTYVAVLHGGPGAPGYMAPVASRLGRKFYALEPFQRHSGPKPLTVDRHIQDLYEIIQTRCEGKPAVVGHSWGAMLGLAYAAKHPNSLSCLALIGCSTFDPESREVMLRIRDARMEGEILEEFKNLEKEYPDPDIKLGEYGRIFKEIDSYDLITGNRNRFSCDSKAHQETWSDMMRLQEKGAYPASFEKIKCPTIMLHGTHDPHPGKMIEKTLRNHIPQLEYAGWEKCGHYPWLEKAARDNFYRKLMDWISVNMSEKTK